MSVRTVFLAFLLLVPNLAQAAFIIMIGANEQSIIQTACDMLSSSTGVEITSVCGES